MSSSTARAPGEVQPGDLDFIAELRLAGVDFVTGVADSAFKDLIADLERSDLYVAAPREDVAVALAAGASLSGSTALVFMESSGLGNAIDAITSLAWAYGLPMALVIAWAGYRGRDVPHHNAIGEPLEPVVRALRLPVAIMELGPDPTDFAAHVSKTLSLSREASRPAALLGVPPSLA